MGAERGVQRGIIGLSAFLMIMCGIGICASLAIGVGAMLGNVSLGIYTVHWAHGFSIMIPGILGIFVCCACGCCNVRAAYIVSAVFDSLGLVALLGPLFYLWALDYLFLAMGNMDCSYVAGSCVCSGVVTQNAFSISTGGFGLSFNDNCERYSIMYACGAALASMWAFGAIATIVHLALVCYMACVMRETTPGHVIYAPGQQPIPMQSQQAYYPSGQAYPQQQAYPPQQEAYPSKGF